MNGNRILLPIQPAEKHLPLPALLVFCAFTAGLSAAANLWIQCPSIPQWIGYSLIATACIVRHPFLRISAACVAGFVLWQSAVSNEKMIKALINNETSSVTCSGTIVAVPVPTTTGVRFLLTVDSTGGDPILVGRTILCRASLPVPPYGRVRVSGAIRSPQTPRNPYGFDERQWARTAGFCAIMQVESSRVIDTMRAGFIVPRMVRSAILNVIEQAHSFNNKALLSATFLNETGSVPDELQQRFRNAGMSHLLAISGYHVMVLAGSIVFLTAFLPIPRRFKPIPPALAAWLYLLFIGAIPSLLRAVIMSSIVFSTPWIARRTDPLNTLGLAGIAILTWSPFALLSAGFQLSFSATAGIMFVHGMIDKEKDITAGSPLIKNAKRAITEAIAGSLAAFVATLPILLWFFGSISWYGLIANLPAIPLMGCAMNLFLAAGVLNIIHPILSTIPLWATERCLDLIVAITTLPGPYGAIPVGQPSMWIIATATIPLLLPLLTPPRARKKGIILSLSAGFCLLPAAMGCSSKMPPPSLIRFSAKDAQVFAIRSGRSDPMIIIHGEKEGVNRAREAIRPWLQMECRSHIGTLILFSGDDAPRVVASFRSLFSIDRIVAAGEARSALTDECIANLVEGTETDRLLLDGDAVRLQTISDTVDIQEYSTSIAWKSVLFSVQIIRDTLLANGTRTVIPPSDSLAAIITVHEDQVSINTLQ